MAIASEFARLARLRPHLAGTSTSIPVGVGDDAAVVQIGSQGVVICADTIVEGVHFTRELFTPEDVGWKAIAVNASDLAAMGATPRAVVVCLQRPPGTPEDVVDRLYAGMAEAAAVYGLPIVGGDTSDCPVLSLAVTAIGEPGQQIVRRGGANVGDVIGLVGPLGGSAGALHAWRRGIDAPDRLWWAHRRPLALDRVGPALAWAGASAMIDVSDGLGADGAHIARASDVQLRLEAECVADAAHPDLAEVADPDRAAAMIIGGGEDFALLVTLPPGRWDAALTAVQATGQGQLLRLGEVAEGAGVVLVDEDGGEVEVSEFGYRHG